MARPPAPRPSPSHTDASNHIGFAREDSPRRPEPNGVDAQFAEQHVNPD